MEAHPAPQHWDEFRGALRAQVSPVTWQTWLQEIEFAGIDEDGSTLHLMAPSEFHLRWINDKHHRAVTDAAIDVFGDVDIVLTARPPENVILPPVGPRLGWRFYAMAVLLLGVVTLGAWLFVKLHRLNYEKPEGLGQLSLPESFYDQLDRCAQRLNLRRKPRVVTTTSIQSPAVFGLFRPVLLMPVGYIRKLSRKDTEYMLLHELAHIKRGDLIAHSLYMLVQLVYWYNPLLWLV
ncbi:hypothetical protein HQ535_15230, partial [bacterium]|nr:hypothetical protein [bacterium]